MSTFHDRRQARANVGIDILPPEEAKGKVIHFKRPTEVVDAHFVPVRDRANERGTVHSFRHGRNLGSALPVVRKSLFGVIAERAEIKLLRLPHEVFMATVAVAVVAVFILFGGFSLIPRGKPAQLSSPIDITHVTMTPQDANGMRVLLINGIVENHSGNRLAMPSIRAEFLSGETVVASTLISTSASQIGAGQSFGFSARVPHPGGKLPGGKLPDLRLSLVQRGA
jgi:hypothetical protein